ncbi:hypothetical protein ABH307_01785 [Acinetobacter pittii]
MSLNPSYVLRQQEVQIGIVQAKADNTNVIRPQITANSIQPCLES